MPAAKKSWFRRKSLLTKAPKCFRPFGRRQGRPTKARPFRPRFRPRRRCQSSRFFRRPKAAQKLLCKSDLCIAIKSRWRQSSFLSRERIAALWPRKKSRRAKGLSWRASRFFWAALFGLEHSSGCRLLFGLAYDFRRLRFGLANYFRRGGQKVLAAA